MSQRDSVVVAGDHFEVAPAVSGLPLASRSRRVLAMLVDLAIIALPSVAIKNPFAPAAALLAAVLYRQSSKWRGARWQSSAGLASRRAIAFGIVAFGLVAGQLWSWNHPKRHPATSPEESQMALEQLDEVMGSLADFDQLSPQARQKLKTAREALANFRSSPGKGGAGSDAGESGEVRRLRAQNLALAQQMVSLEEELKEARKDRGVLHFLKATAKDLGIGLGWSGLYFIIFPVLWNGRTPGKRLMQIRVARLNGKPISWWNAFERFHGYVSCLVGGLIGFLQVVWDPQSQGHHDKVAETVVVRDSPIVMALPVASASQADASHAL